MKPAGLPLLAFVFTGAAMAAQEADPSRSTRTSVRLRQEIQSALPKYTPPAPPPTFDQMAASEPDPNVLALPKFTVKEYRPRDHDPDVWLTGKAVEQKAMAAYKQSLTNLEWALNGWYIPLFGSSPSARARASYAGHKNMAELQRVHRLFKLISTTDARAGAELESERVKMEQAEHWQRRPAGDGRSK